MKKWSRLFGKIGGILLINFIVSILIISGLVYFSTDHPPFYYRDLQFNLDTKYKSNSYDEAQQNALKALYEFYRNRDSDIEFCEVVSPKYRFLVNYDAEYQVLSVETDLGSGWSHMFNKIKETDLKRLSEMGLCFSEYNKYLSTFLLKTNSRKKIFIVKSYHNYFDAERIKGGGKMAAEEFMRLTK